MTIENLNFTFNGALGTQTNRIFVGAERKCYVVHTDLLISLLDYFLNALTSVNDKREEECVDSYDIPAEDPVVVGLLVEWLYRGSFPDPEHKNPVSARRNRKKAEKLPSMDHRHYSTWVEKEHPSSKSMAQDSFIHICFQPCFRALSPEEIRPQDYNTGLRYQESSIMPPPTTISNISKLSPAPLTQQEVIGFGGLQPNRITTSPFSKPFADSQTREVAGPPFKVRLPPVRSLHPVGFPAQTFHPLKHQMAPRALRILQHHIHFGRLEVYRRSLSQTRQACFPSHQAQPRLLQQQVLPHPAPHQYQIQSNHL